MNASTLRSNWKRLSLTAVLATAAAYGSSHREALAVLNEPCADNTDTFAWVSNSSHDKLYLVMDFNPLHEPGQGNQGLEGTRAQNSAGTVRNGPGPALEGVTVGGWSLARPVGRSAVL